MMKLNLFIALITLSFSGFAGNPKRANPGASRSKKVLVFWYGMGSGHRIPAERIAAYIKKSSPGSKVKLVDMRDFSLYDRSSEEKGKKKYLAWATKESASYTKYFEWHLEKEPQNIKSNFDLYRISKYLIKEKPNAIITVFWGAAHALYTLKSIFPDSFKTPTSLLYTDYGVRKFVFMVPTIDKIFLGSRKMYQEVFKKYPELQIYRNNFDYSGIPVDWDRIKKLKKMSKPEAKKILGLDPHARTIALARGGEAFISFTGIIKKLTRDFERKKINYQIIALAGGSKRDREELVDLQKKYPGRIKILGFIKNETYITYIRAANVFVTKPGGVGLTEAGLIGTPLIIMQGLGGQENDNKNEFVNSKMAYFESSEEKIVRRIDYILNTPMASIRILSAQKYYFKEYDPAKIAKWTLNSYGDTNWAKFKKDLEKSSKKKRIQEKEDLDPLALRNWFFYLNEVSLSDISKSKIFKKAFQKKAHSYINIAIRNNRRKINHSKQEIKNAKDQKTRSTYLAKWELFRAIILDQVFHINLNQTYVNPDRDLLDPLVVDLLRFLETDIFASELAVWEFTKGSLYSYLSNFYFMARNNNLAQRYITLALKEYPPNNTGETIIQLQGDIYQRRKKNKEAIKFFEKYLKFNPHMDLIRISLAKIYDEENQISKAEREYKKIFNQSSKHLENEYFQFASFYMRNNQKRKALKILLQGVNDRKESISLNSLLIRLISSTPEFKKTHAKDLKKAIGDYKRLQKVELKKLEELPLLFED